MKTFSGIWSLALVAIVGFSPVAEAQNPPPGVEKVAKTVHQPKSMLWHPQIAYRSVTLRVAGPGGYFFEGEFGAGVPVFDLSTQAGIADGQYTYELIFGLRPDAALEKAMVAHDLDAEGMISNPALREQVDALRVTTSGSFRVEGGQIISPYLVEQSNSLLAPKTVFGEPKIVLGDPNVSIQSSLCVGFDCTNAESFGFDTIRLKENNTRIGFADTSIAPFPANAWQITANDSASGGANKFSIEDITGAKVPFTVSAGAPTNSLFISSTGRVGFRTATPVLDLHAVNNNTPAIRLEQDSSGGFTAQTWDIAGNEANFFVRDVTGGSRLPFRIRPGAPTSSIDIAASGNVGIGTASPAYRLDVTGSMRLTNASVIAWNNTSGAPTPVLQKYSNNAVYMDSYDGPTYLRTGNPIATAVTLSTSQNVGIGTQNPAFKLDVAGAVRLRNAQALYWNNAAGVATPVLQKYSNNAVYIDSYDGATYLRTGSPFATAMAISATQNVGIGTVSPTHKLHVVGDSKIEGTLQITGGTIIPDYVFDPGFKLASIEENAAYMWKNRHLPAVPPGKTTEDGRGVIDVFAQSNGILEELEKAHIYIETLHREIKALRIEAQARDAEVRKELAELRERLDK